MDFKPSGKKIYDLWPQRMIHRKNFSLQFEVELLESKLGLRNTMDMMYAVFFLRYFWFEQLYFELKAEILVMDHSLGPQIIKFSISVGNPVTLSSNLQNFPSFPQNIQLKVFNDLTLILQRSLFRLVMKSWRFSTSQKFKSKSQFLIFLYKLDFISFILLR
jgi:hypothetical protein